MERMGMSEKDKHLATIFMHSVTKGDSISSHTIPQNCLDLSKPWKDDLKD
jgi:hypothetical protein